MTVLSQHGKQPAGTELHFLSRDEIDYPQLTRLCLDFDFRVLGVSPKPQAQSTRYFLSDKHYRNQGLVPVTPLFDSLMELERYTNTNIIDILRDTLFEEAEE